MIDCDVHNELPSSEVLLPYLEPYWREYMERGENRGGRKGLPYATRSWLHPEDFKRLDAKPADGAPQGSDIQLMREQLLDLYDVEHAVLTGGSIINISTMAHPQYAAALARAHNEWQNEHWLPLDERLLGSILVAPQDPTLAAEEIRRLAGTPRVAQVLLPAGTERPYGDPFYRPIFDTAAECGLPVAMHLGGQGGFNSNPTGCGPPTFFWEFHALLCETAMGHVASLIAHGVFERHPELVFVPVELGVAWLPGVLWRLDMDWRALRKETPWLERLPSEVARTNIRVTTQPLEIPREAARFWEALEEFGAREMLLFATDYPHWDFDDPDHVAIPQAWREDVLSENARKLYKLPARVAA